MRAGALTIRDVFLALIVGVIAFLLSSNVLIVLLAVALTLFILAFVA